MIVQLGAECTGNVRVKETLQKVDEVRYDGHTHYQFNALYSCKVQMMKLWTLEKKKVRQSVYVDMEDREVEEDSDGEDDDDEDEMPV